MSYCVMSIEKLKTMSKIKSAMLHNLREMKVDNADPEFAHLNEVIVPNEKPIEELIQEKLQYRKSITDRKLRKDAVLAFEVLLGYSKDDSVDIEKWKEENLKWLQETFNKSPDGKDNVLSVTFHMDETNPHIHAIVAPMDEEGYFRYKSFVDGPHSLKKMQSEYAHRMEKFGLKRGLENSVAKKVDIRHFYAQINHTMKSVEKDLAIQQDETLEQYHHRTVNYYKDVKGSYEKQICDKDREIVELKTQLNNYEKKHSMDEIVQANIARKEAEKTKEKYQGILREYKTIENIEKKLDSAKRLNDAIVNCDDKEFQKDFLERMHMLIDKEEERKKREKHLEREQKAREKLER